MNELSPLQLGKRAFALGILTLGFLGLRTLDPSSFSLFKPSCGTLTGLPCLFCGTTRALHCLLTGNLSQALYFNWLAFPLALLAGIIAAKLAGELCFRHRLFPRILTFRLTPRFALLVAGGITALWVLQVSLALGAHKHELLNRSGILYSILVR